MALREPRLFRDASGHMVTTLESDDNGVVKFTALGGGFVRTMTAKEFGKTFALCDLPPYGEVSVAIEDFGEPGTKFLAYSDGRCWNGWAMPYFPFESALALKEVMGGLRYDAGRDAFILEVRGEEPEDFVAEVIQVDGVDIKVYPIGAGSWCWDIVKHDAPERPMRP